MAEAPERRVALVTGGLSGIGRGVVDLLRDRGHAVGILDAAAELPSDPREPAIVDGDPECVAVRCDVSEWTQVRPAVDAVAARFGGLHIVVNSAGVLTRGGLLDLDVRDWERTVAVNLTGTFHVMKAAAAHLRSAGWGRVVNLTSIAGTTRVGRGIPAYGASKAGVIGLTRDSTRELGEWGVTVNAVAPGAVTTPMVSGNDVWEAAMVQASPLRRICLPDEFARIIGFLVSEDGGYITGTTVVADGGMTSGIPIPDLPNG